VQWKKANVVPMPKKGKENKPSHHKTQTDFDFRQNNRPANRRLN